MAITDLYNKTATICRKTVASTNEYGESKFTEDESSSFNCAFQPDKGDYEVKIQGKVKRSTHRVYCATTVVVEAGDEIKIGGIKYRVLAVLDDGGRTHHYKVMLELVS